MNNDLLLNFILIGTAAYVLGMVIVIGTCIFLIIAISEINECRAKNCMAYGFFGDELASEKFSSSTPILSKAKKHSTRFLRASTGSQWED